MSTHTQNVSVVVDILLLAPTRQAFASNMLAEAGEPRTNLLNEIVSSCLPSPPISAASQFKPKVPVVFIHGTVRGSGRTTTLAAVANQV